MGGGGRRKEGDYTSRLFHHEDDSRIKVGSGESHFNVLLTVRDKVTRQRPETTAVEERGEPRRNRTGVLLFIIRTPYG